MKTATLTISRAPSPRKLRIEIDVEQWERIADALGLYQPRFLKSLKQSEREIREGKIRKLRSLKDLRLS